MNPRTSGLFIGTIVLATFVTGALVYPQLPLFAASHWNAAGDVNGTLPRFWAAFLLPLMLLGFWGLWALLPRIDPIAPGFKGFRHVYDFSWILISAFLAYVYALTLGVNLGWQANVAQMLFLPLGVLIILIGALMRHIRRNWFFGIRTPWTLSNDTVWDKTHKLGSRLFELSGLFVLGAAFTTSPYGWLLVIVPIVLAAVISAVYSYLILARGK